MKVVTNVGPHRVEDDVDAFAARQLGGGAKTRGRRAKAGGDHSGIIQIDETQIPSRTHARRRWAALIQQVWRVDPLVCTRCGARLRIVAFITPARRAVIERILRHRGLWEASPRAPPHDDHAAPREAEAGELRYVSDLEYIDPPAPAEPVWTGH